MIITPISTRRSTLKRVLCLLTATSSLPPLHLTAQDKTSYPMTSNPRLHSFVGGLDGPWQVTSQHTLIGDSLPTIERLHYLPENITPPPIHASWVLHGTNSNERYVTRTEKEQLLAKQQALGRPEATCAVLIPIKKNAEWWALTQDERRNIFEEQSHHNKIGMDYLPAIARRLHHCRDLTSPEPFDFLTWFEFAEEHTAEFNQLLTRLRATEEWKYVEREVEVRVTKA